MPEARGSKLNMKWSWASCAIPTKELSRSHSFLLPYGYWRRMWIRYEIDAKVIRLVRNSAALGMCTGTLCGQGSLKTKNKDASRQTNYTDLNMGGLTVYQLLCSNCFMCTLLSPSKKQLNCSTLALFHSGLRCSEWYLQISGNFQDLST